MAVQTRTTALQNEIVRLYFTFEYNGRLSSPSGQPRVEIISSDGATILDHVPATVESTGIYYADWYVPADLPLGDYYDRWTFQWTTTAGIQEETMVFNVCSLESYINFISSGINHYVSSNVVQMMKDLANDFIYEAQHIPVYWEQAMRIRQENQAKRTTTFYYFTLDSNRYNVEEGAEYTNNAQTFSVKESLIPFYSSSSTSSESEGNVSTSSNSITSSSSSTSTSSSSSESSESSTHVTTTTTTAWHYKPILTCSGTGVPEDAGVLTKISGTGPNTITFEGWTSKTSRFSTVYNAAYKNWNKDPRPIVRLNNRIVDDGWYVDYNGNMYFDGLLAPEDSVNVKYNFAYFSIEEMTSFLDMGLNMMNSVPPSSIVYTSLDTMPVEWYAPVLLYAAILALKRLIFGLNWQEQRIIFGEPEDAQRAIDNFKSLYTEYNTTWMEIKKDAKTRKLAGLAISVTPEYSLPGGRSRWFRYLYKSN